MSTINQYLITLTRIRDGKDFGQWQTHGGGDIESAEVTTRDGYGLPRKQLGAPPTTTVITCSRVFYPDTDNNELDELRKGVGVGDRFTVNKQKLSPDGHTTGTPFVQTGVLKGVKEAEVNVADDTPGVDTYTVEIAPDGP